MQTSSSATASSSSTTPPGNVDKRKWQDFRTWFRRLWPDEMDGKFSISRLKAFEEYRQQKSKLWMILVVVLTPVPSTLVAIGLNFFPLVHPTRGWKANYMFFIRVFVEAVICTQTSRSQRNFYFADTESRIQFDWGFRLLLGLVMVGSSLGLAALVKFPLPFNFLISLCVGSPLIFIVGRFMVRKMQRTLSQLSRYTSRTSQVLAAGQSTFSENESLNFDPPPNQVTNIDTSTHTTPDPTIASTPLGAQHFQEMVRSYTHLMMFHMLIIFVYPVFLVGYNMLDGTSSQMMYFLTQPILRKLLAIAYRHLASQTPDLVNEMQSFSVRFMAVLFRAIFSVSSSWLLVGILIMWDLIDLVYCFSRMIEKHDTIQVIWDQLTSHQLVKKCQRDSVSEGVNFVDQHKSLLLTQNSAMNLRWIGSNGTSLYKPSGLSSFLSKGSRSRRKGVTTICVQAAFPMGMDRTKSLTPEEINSQRQMVQNQLILLDNTLTLMSLMEYVVLGEYGETIIPFFYAVYIALSGVSPCRNFLRNILHYEQTGHALSSVVSWMLLYSTIELATFVLLWVLTIWRLRFNLLEVLAFVLETHFVDIQAKMIFFLMIAFDFNLIHYGVDFSFKFDDR